jgi:hypothetical protein
VKNTEDGQTSGETPADGSFTLRGYERVPGSIGHIAPFDTATNYQHPAAVNILLAKFPKDSVIPYILSVLK